eukprot:COSAG01_NODE_44377_length_419_cov_28.821875_1_plen_102_part_10
MACLLQQQHVPSPPQTFSNQPSTVRCGQQQHVSGGLTIRELIALVRALVWRGGWRLSFILPACLQLVLPVVQPALNRVVKPAVRRILNVIVPAIADAYVRAL